MKTKVIVGIALIIISVILLIYGMFEKKEVVEEELPPTMSVEVSKEVETSTKSTNTTTKKKTAKKTIKTTNKTTTSVEQQEMMNYAHSLVVSYGWNEEDYNAIIKIVYKESNWNANSVNKSSGACGLFQAYPCSKMESAGKDYRTNYKTQIKWGFDYIKSRYGTPTNAWKFWLEHHWY